MADPVALNSQAHHVMRIDVDRARRESAGGNVISVIPREFQRLVAHYPIFFARSPDSDQFEPVALLGFHGGENLFLLDGLWDASYIPLQIQREPFVLLSRGDTAGAAALDLALDVTLPCVQTQKGERLFADDGKTTPYLQNIGTVMQLLVVGSREAHAFTAKLAEFHLLEPVRIDIEFVDASKTQLQGLHWIAASALKSLAAASLAELRDLDYLEWLYVQMASLAHVPALVNRKNRQLGQSQKNL